MIQQEVNNSAAPKAIPWLIAIGLWLVAWSLVSLGGLMSAMSVWYVNDTYNHCFFILPGALYMIWLQRGAVMEQKAKYSVLGLLLIFILLIIFALGQAAYIDVLQHIAIFMFVPTMALSIFGFYVVKKILFPLAFILFSIPVGEEFIPMFQDITAAMSMYILKLLNIPAFRDGLYISIPGGNFVVAEACSGVRFFITCAVLGSVYAYLNFISRWRMFAFAALSVVIPIIANGIRASGIMYVGYISNMQHAVAADHLIYGWLFFFIVVLILLGIGRLFSDGRRQWYSEIYYINETWSKLWNRKSLAMATIPLILMLVIQLVVKHQQGGGEHFILPQNQLIKVDSTQMDAKDWAPRFHYADEYRFALDEASGINLYQAVYYHNIQNRELISWLNRIYDQNLWSLQGQYKEHLQGVGMVSVLELTSVSGRRRLVAYWYTVSERVSSNRNLIKLQQAVNTLVLSSSGGAITAASFEYQGDSSRAKARLREFLAHEVKDLAVVLP